jgi:hypothetical protein
LQNFSYFNLERVMPLIHSPSKKALRENIRTEIVEGHKPIKQAVAIGYAEQRHEIAEKAHHSATHHIAERHHAKHGKC